MNLATVERIEEVRHHPNADRLDLVRVLNFWAIVPRDKHKAGNLCVYIQPDSVLPDDREWATTYLAYTRKGRVRAVRLRGEWSEGIVLGVDTLRNVCAIVDEDSGEENDYNFSSGDDVTELFGVTKHEPPEQKHGFKEVKGYLPFDIPKTDENNWRRLRLEPFIGKLVDVTLKIDGQSFTAYCVWNEATSDWITGICSRSLDLKMGFNEETEQEYDSNWHKIEAKYDVLKKLREYCEIHDVSLALRGEQYGPGIQSFKHNSHSHVPALDVGFYSVWNVESQGYEGPNSKHYYEKVCAALALPTVPMIENQVPLTYELLEKYDTGISKLNDQSFEGVVIKGDEFHCKVINKHYDSEK